MKKIITMCQDNTKFIFCTCEDVRKNLSDSEAVKDYTWTLIKFLGLKKKLSRGKIAIPKQDLGNGVTIENILHQLNSKTESFDFDYQPKEKDCLKISVSNINDRTKHFSVLYKNGNWIEGRNSPFITISEKIATGKIFKMK